MSRTSSGRRSPRSGVAVERTLRRGADGDIDGAGESLAGPSRPRSTRLQPARRGTARACTRVPLADAVRERVDVAAVAWDRAVMWRELAREQQVVDLAVAAPAGADAMAVPGAVDQILDNLLDNAVEVAPPVRRSPIDVTDVGAEVVVAVVDHGPGMIGADRARAFDRFWRADGSSGDGIGIGLTIVRGPHRGVRRRDRVAPGRRAGGRVRCSLLEAVPGRGVDPVGLPAAATHDRDDRAGCGRGCDGTSARRDPERAAAVEAEVWLACTRAGTEIDGCEECATAVFALARDRHRPTHPPTGRQRRSSTLTSCRTLGGLDTDQIAEVLEVTPRYRRAARTARPPHAACPSSTAASCLRPRRLRASPAPAHVGAIAAAAAVAATGTAAATRIAPGSPCSTGWRTRAPRRAE